MTFIVFEGGEGSGKSTQAARLASCEAVLVKRSEQGASIVSSRGLAIHVPAFPGPVRDVSGPDVAARIAERLADAVTEPMSLRGEPVVVTPSIGIALAGQAEKPERLIERADEAMYAAKRAGSTYQLAPDAETQHQPSTLG